MSQSAGIPSMFGGRQYWPMNGNQRQMASPEYLGAEPPTPLITCKVWIVGSLNPISNSYPIYGCRRTNVERQTRKRARSLPWRSRVEVSFENFHSMFRGVRESGRANVLIPIWDALVQVSPHFQPYRGFQPYKGFQPASANNLN